MNTVKLYDITALLVIFLVISKYMYQNLIEIYMPCGLQCACLEVEVINDKTDMEDDQEAVCNNEECKLGSFLVRTKS